MSFKFRGLAAAVTVLLVSTSAYAADVPISEEAKAHFTAGVSLIQDPDGAKYEEAYREFKAAYAASPSWKILGNLGLSAMKLERDGEAIVAYRKYLAEGGAQIDADERAQCQRDLQTLEAGVSQLTLQSEPAGAVLEDERLPTTGSVVRNDYGPLNGVMTIGVHPGKHRLTVKLPGHQDAVWEVVVAPGQPQTHIFKLGAAGSAAPPPPPPPRPTSSFSAEAPKDGGSGMRIGSYVALGVGVVGVGLGTFFAVSSKGKYDDANAIASSNCPSAGRCGLQASLFDEREQKAKDADGLKTLSIVSFAVGGAALATGVTLFALSGKKEEPRAARVQPYVTLGGLGVVGRFQ